MDTLMSTGNPNDTIWSGRTGKYVAIIGQNLQNALSIKINGVAVSFNSALLAPNSAVVPIPDIVYSAIDTTKLYTLEYVTTTGSTIFSFKLGPLAPTISAISNVFANPGDSVYIYGKNLVLVQNFSYGGTPITQYKTNVDGTALGFVMPDPAPASGEVSVTTKTNTATFKIVAFPTIIGVSNLNASPGDSVYVYGTYLKGIKSFTFSGTDISSFVSAADGSSVAFKMPTITTNGPASITTPFGTGTTVYDVYNVYNVLHAGSAATGILGNMEWGSAFGWNWDGAGPSLVQSNKFDGVYGTNTTQYVFMDKTSMKSGAGSSGGWANAYQFGVGANQWIPVANLSDPVENWAVQLEISVAKPWNGATLCFETGFAGNYVARYEPWQVTASTTKDFSTKGWQTLTIPLSSFRGEDTKLGKGKGASVSSIINLIGSTGNTSLSIYLHNFGNSPTSTGFYGAFDNVRVVKIK